MHIAKLFLIKIICMNCAQWDWTDSSNSWKVVTNLFSLSIERLDELEMLEKVSWKSSNYLVWWRCLPSPLPPTRLKAARPAPGTWCIIVLVKKYPLYDRAMWSPTLHCMPDQVCAGCRSQIRKIFEFKIWKEPMLVVKHYGAKYELFRFFQILHQVDST